MKLLVLIPEERFLRYRPDFANSLDIAPVFVPEDRSPLTAAAAHADAEAIWADPGICLTEEVFRLLPRLKLVQSEGAACHRFDLEAARRRGIYVCSCRGCNASSVAEHAIMLMLMSLRFGLTGHEAVRQGRQAEMKQRVMVADAPELGSCTVGLVGFGAIGQATALRLRPFGCALRYYSLHRRSPEIEQQFGISWLPLEELVQSCDVISLHCAVTDRTRGMIDDHLLQHWKPGSILVNTARGDLLDNMAVRRALLDGTIGALAADTLAPEPTPADHPLVDLPPGVRDRAIYSPHLGGNTGPSFHRVYETMWRNLAAIRSGSVPENIVNGL